MSLFKSFESKYPTICALPWTHIFANNEGHLHACCMAESFDSGVVNDQGENYKVEEPEGLKKAWNSNYMKNLRQQMLRGERPDICFRCYNDEDNGLKSYRQSKNEQFSDFVKRIPKNTKSDGTAKDEVKFIDLRLGNLCNLKCRMCHPVASRKWIDEWNLLFENALSEDRKKFLNHLDWFETDTFWNNLDPYIPHIEALHLAGGEPLAIAKSFEFKKKLIELGYSKNISLTYNTNATLLPKQVFECWPHFKSVKVMASIDGLADVNHYVRFPAKFNAIERNLNTLEQNKNELNIEPVDVICTVQILNIYDLVPLLRYLHQNFAIVNPNITLNLLTDPNCYSIRVLPEDAKHEIKSQLETYKKEACSGLLMSRMRDNIDGVISYMMGGDLTDQLVEFKRRTRIIDKSRNQSLELVAPELVRAIGWKSQTQIPVSEPEVSHPQP